jgi:dienelactone hydrolase
VNRRFIAAAAAATLLAACSSDGSETASTPVASPATSPASTPPTDATDSTGAATTTTSAPTTTIDPLVDARAYAEPGPFPVGVTTLQLAKGPSVEVWYPAAEGTTGEVSYDVRDFVPPAIAALLTGDAPATYTIAAGRDAVAGDGTFPLVLFSHGFTGIRTQSTFLTSHLASWGFVVAAPDHPSRDLFNVLAGTASGDRDDSVDDLLQTLTLLEDQSADPSSLLAGRVDTDTVLAVGHSAGGGTVFAAANDERIDGYVSMASGFFSAEGTEPVIPDKPSLFLAGTTDFVVPAADATTPAFEAAPAPSVYWLLDGVGHNGFDDFCTLGNGTGIIGLAEASGLGPLLDGQPQLRTLGEDGCVPPSVPVADSFPPILHAVTSWVRLQTGQDSAPVGLTDVPADAWLVDVSVLSK